MAPLTPGNAACAGASVSVSAAMNASPVVPINAASNQSSMV